MARKRRNRQSPPPVQANSETPKRSIFERAAERSSKAIVVIFVGAIAAYILAPLWIVDPALGSIFHLIGECARPNDQSGPARRLASAGFLSLAGWTYVAWLFSLTVASDAWFIAIPLTGGAIEKILEAHPAKRFSGHGVFLLALPLAVLAASMSLTVTPSVLLMSDREAGLEAQYSRMTLAPQGGVIYLRDTSLVIVSQSPHRGTVKLSAKAWTAAPLPWLGEMWPLLSYSKGKAPSITITGFSDRSPVVPTDSLTSGCTPVSRYSRIHGRVKNFDPAELGQLEFRVLVLPNRAWGWRPHDKSTRRWWLQNPPMFGPPDSIGERAWYADIWVGDQTYREGERLAITALIAARGSIRDRMTEAALDQVKTVRVSSCIRRF
jgi:hypothetical protein